MAKICCLRRIFRSMIASTPFIPANVNRIRWVGALVIPVSVLAQLIQLWLGRTQAAGVDSLGLTLNPEFSLDMGVIVLGLIIFSLAEVFRYGLDLRNEADLTV